MDLLQFNLHKKQAEKSSHNALGYGHYDVCSKIIFFRHIFVLHYHSRLANQQTLILCGFIMHYRGTCLGMFFILWRFIFVMMLNSLALGLI